MKVDILGKGLIPLLYTLAPRYNVELDAKQIRTLLRYRQFNLVTSEENILITNANVDNLLNRGKQPVVVPAVQTPVEPVIVEEEPKKEEYVVPEITVEETPVEEESVEVEVTEEINEETESEEEEPVEEVEVEVKTETIGNAGVEEEEEPKKSNKKNKKRRRN